MLVAACGGSGAAPAVQPTAVEPQAPPEPLDALDCEGFLDPAADIGGAATFDLGTALPVAACDLFADERVIIVIAVPDEGRWRERSRLELPPDTHVAEHPISPTEQAIRIVEPRHGESGARSEANTLLRVLPGGDTTKIFHLEGPLRPAGHTFPDVYLDPATTTTNGYFDLQVRHVERSYPEGASSATEEWETELYRWNGERYALPLE